MTDQEFGQPGRWPCWSRVSGAGKQQAAGLVGTVGLHVLHNVERAPFLARSEV